MTARLARLLEIVTEAVVGLDGCVESLGSSFPLPHVVEVNGMPVFRHQRKNDLLLSYLKLVKIASHQNAAIVLIRAGYVQEVYTLCRMIDEAIEDVYFMASPLDDGKPKACGRGPWIGISREEDDELVVVRASGCRADGEDQSRRWRAAGWDREEAGAAPLDGGGEGSDRAGDGAHRGGDARDRAAARCAREHAEAVACAVSSG